MHVFAQSRELGQSMDAKFNGYCSIALCTKRCNALDDVNACMRRPAIVVNLRYVHKTAYRRVKAREGKAKREKARYMLGSCVNGNEKLRSAV